MPDPGEGGAPVPVGAAIPEPLGDGAPLEPGMGYGAAEAEVVKEGTGVVVTIGTGNDATGEVTIGTGNDVTGEVTIGTGNDETGEDSMGAADFTASALDDELVEDAVSGGGVDSPDVRVEVAVMVFRARVLVRIIVEVEY
ncbi:MAG: hypothetical protein Q9181_004219 [Wetmoreana brouardii]